ncbi:MAG: MFS transporter, partial [Hyphomicrobiales bacterium]|nr:MFS transporter [Hyphomicrobiales bacterium]
MVFAQTLFTRAVDPVVPMIADDLAIEVKTAALLSSAYTFPYALVQPALGVTGDFFGKTRLMNLCLLVVALSALVCAAATSFSLLIAMRVAAGLVAGGIFPVAMALTGDLVPVNQRQVAIGRLLAVGLTGNLVGSSIAGVIGDLLGWRGVFAILGSFGLIVTIAAFFAFRGVVTPPPARFHRAAVMANFRSIFADPRAKVCFTSVFFEAVFIHGLFPYVALLLLVIGEPRASIAGLLIAAFAMGGVFYSLSVPALIAHVRERHLMVAGGALAATGLVLIALQVPWMWQIAVYGIFGFGFYLLHGSIQVHVTELSQTARGAAASLHSSFFYLGQAVGP